MTARRAWVIFIAIVFGVLNAGVDHATERELASTGVHDARDALDGIRLLYTDSGDPHRYFAYANAILGRPCSGYFVRTEAAWREEFRAGVARDPDAVPELVPTAPLVPYRDFAVEYPPLFFAAVVPIAAVVHDGDGFRVAFGLAMSLAFALATLLALRLARGLDHQPDHQLDHQPGPAVPAPRLVLWLGLAALCLGGIVTHRFDALVALALVGTLVAMIEDRPALTGAVLGIAVGLKLVPLAIAPIVALRWLAAGRWRALGTAAATGGVVLALALAPLALVEGGLTGLVRYHATRPLQVESTWAAGLRLVSALDGSRLDVVRSYGSINAEGDHAQLAIAVSTAVLVLALLAVLALTWRRLRDATVERDRMRVLVRGAIAMLVVLMTLGKVFSPQYVIWLLPLAVPMALGDGRRSLVALVAILVLTQLTYPIGNVALQHGDLWVSAVVLLRNLALLAWATLPLVRRAAP